MLNRAQDGIASSLRSQLFKSLLIDRAVEWYHLKSDGIEKDETTPAVTPTPTSTDPENDPSPLSSHSPSAIQSILTKDVETVSSTITTTFANTFRSTCSIIFATRNMFRINPHLLSISLSIVPLIGSAAVLLNKFVKKITNKYHAITEEAEEFATERIDHIATVKTSNRQYDEVEHYNVLQNDARKLSHKASFAKGLFMGFMFSSSSSALVMLFHIGGRNVASGRMTFGELKTFATYTFMLGLGTSGLMKGLGQMMQGMICAERIYDLIYDTNGDSSDTTTAKEETEKISSLPIDSVEKVSLSNVNFAYASDKAKTILKDISLSMERGKVIALAGSNGSGKSTLASLLVALYKPQSGTVSIEGNGQEGEEEQKVDFHSLDRKTQSSLVQLVPQNPVLFDMTIRENVTYSNPNVTEDEIQQALTASNCNTFVSNLKGGIEYNVGRNGCKLSGGQRQRLALARALLCDPALLILDEPNSSMDAEGDNAVADAVKNCRSGDHIQGGNKKRGLLLITHRVSTLELADEIVVLKDGSIVEQGSYDALVANKDSELCRLMPDLQ